MGLDYYGDSTITAVVIQIISVVSISICLIRLAALTRSVLISTDKRLKKKVESFCKEYGIKLYIQKNLDHYWDLVHQIINFITLQFYTFRGRKDIIRTISKVLRTLFYVITVSITFR